MFIEVLAFGVLILLALVCLAAVTLRATGRQSTAASGIVTRLDVLSGAFERSDRTVLDEFARSRSAATEEARLLRSEILTSFGSLTNAVRNTLSDHSLNQKSQLDSFGGIVSTAKAEAAEAAVSLRNEVQGQMTALTNLVSRTISQLIAQQAEKLDAVGAQVSALTEANERRMETLRISVDAQLVALRTENSDKLEQMRATVDEKLQGTLEQRLGAAFQTVSQQLEQVHTSVGEMRQIATGVGDLKRVLTNVRARGAWGEGNLGNLLDQVLAPGQFERNVEVMPGSNQRVEFAIRMPSDDEATLWLPVDAKFPTEDFERLVDAHDRGDAEDLDRASKALEIRVRASAKDISEKYIQPPWTVDIAVLFLPTEALFAEVVRRPGLVDALQRDHRILVAGPTTMLAILSSIRMGYRNVAIQKRSTEVWRVLGAVKAEFEKFGGVMDKVQKKLQEAQNVIEDEVERRQRAMTRKLRDVEALPAAEASRLLALEGSESTSDDADDTEPASAS